MTGWEIRIGLLTSGEGGGGAGGGRHSQRHRQRRLLKTAGVSFPADIARNFVNIQEQSLTFLLTEYADDGRVQALMREALSRQSLSRRNEIKIEIYAHFAAEGSASPCQRSSLAEAAKSGAGKRVRVLKVRNFTPQAMEGDREMWSHLTGVDLYTEEDGVSHLLICMSLIISLFFLSLSLSLSLSIYIYISFLHSPSFSTSSNLSLSPLTCFDDAMARLDGTCRCVSLRLEERNSTPRN